MFIALLTNVITSVRTLWCSRGCTRCARVREKLVARLIQQYATHCAVQDLWTCDFLILHHFLILFRIYVTLTSNLHHMRKYFFLVMALNYTFYSI